MRTLTLKRIVLGAAAGIGVAASLHSAVFGAAPRFFNDDPVWTHRDTQDASGVKPWEIDLMVDLSFNLFGKPGDQTPNVRARNINTVDEVPDSSWFTNRVGRRIVTADEIARGPNTVIGPAPGPWTVTASKIDGVTPGFTIRDANRQLWFLKFDPPGYRAMATGTEVMVTKLLWALGYNVPENYVAHLDRERLVVGDGARFQPPGGVERPMRLSDIATLLEKANREPDGTYRIIASKGLEGTPLGGFRFYDTRPDDPNDVVSHEHRRELRGYGVFAAWLNHVDAKAGNSMDMLIREDGRSVVRHNLLDFGSTLGSGALAPRDYWEGFEYLVEPRETLKQMVSFGFYFPAWHRRTFYDAPSIGRVPFDDARFDPDRWKPRVPNAAFLRARADDRFWAARKLSAMNDDLVRAAARTGEFNDDESEAFLVKSLGQRRNAILRKYLVAVNPIVDPALDPAGVLTFQNAAVEASVAQSPGGYRAVWSQFDNATGASRQLGETAGAAARLEPPAGLPRAPGAMLKIDISARAGVDPSWEKPVHAYFLQREGQWRLVGFERLPDE